MTKREAYERLELPEGADLQEVRRKFAEMYNDYRMHIDNAHTQQTRLSAERRLEELKEAYAVLNESDGMDDSGDLPRTGQTGSFEEPSEKQHGNSDAEKGIGNIDHALAVFGLGKSFPRHRLAATCQQHIADLKAQLVAAALPGIKTAYEAEVAKAERAWQTLAGWLAGQEEELTETGAPQPGAGTDRGKKSSGAGRIAIVVVGLAVLVGGYWWWSRWAAATPTEPVIPTAGVTLPTVADGLETGNDTNFNIGSDKSASVSLLTAEKKENPVIAQQAKKDWRDRYDDIDDFEGGIARVELDDKYGFVDQQGNVLVPVIYNKVRYFSESLAPVNNGFDYNNKGEWGYADKSGRIVIPIGFKMAGAFSGGKALVKFDEDRYGFINKQGKEIRSLTDKNGIRYFLGSGWYHFYEVTVDGKIGFYDDNGDEIIPIKYDDFKTTYNGGLFSKNGLIAVSLNGKWGFVDENDQAVVPFIYEALDHFDDDGPASVKLDGKWGYIDAKGNVVIPMQYDWAESFYHGTAKVSLNKDEFYININGECVDGCPD